MPIYEYCCQNCQRHVSILFRSFSEVSTPRCSHCGSEDLARQVSKVAVLRSEDRRMEDLADPSQFGDLDENDPRSMARFMRKMGDEMGEDLGPDLDEVIDRLESGQSPEEIESSMPALAGGGMPPGGMPPGGLPMPGGF